MKQLIFVMALMVLCQSGCVSTGRLPLGQAQKRYASFGIKPLPHWQQKNFRGADLYFEHDEKNATIFLNAQCEEISDSPLEALLAQQIIGLTKINIEKEERAMLADREALITQLTASIDGVPRLLKIMIMKKNRCVFDAVFSAPLAERSLLADFQYMFETFWAEALL